MIALEIRLRHLIFQFGKKKVYISGRQVVVVMQDKGNGERRVFRIRLSEMVEALNSSSQHAFASLVKKQGFTQGEVLRALKEGRWWVKVQREKTPSS